MGNSVISRFSKLSLLLLQLSSTAAFASDAATSTNTQARIGVLLSLSGEQQLFGSACRNAMELALRKLPEAKRSRLLLQFEDDRFRPSETVVVFNKLQSQNTPLHAVITFGSGTSKSVASRAEELRIPLVAIATDTRVSEGKSHVVNFWPTPDELVRVLVEEMTRLGYKRIARIGTIHDFTDKLNQVFDRTAGGQIKVALDDGFPIDARDFRPFIIKAKALGPLDGILITLLPPQVALFAKQARQLGLTTPLNGIEVFEDAAEVRASEGALVGQWYVNADDPTAEFAKEYSEQYPGASTFAAGNCFDIVGILADAVEPPSHPEQINTYLHSLKDYHGVMGTYSAQPGNTFSFRAVVKEVTPDGFKRR